MKSVYPDTSASSVVVASTSEAMYPDVTTSLRLLMNTVPGAAGGLLLTLARASVPARDIRAGAFAYLPAETLYPAWALNTRISNLITSSLDVALPVEHALASKSDDLITEVCESIRIMANLVQCVLLDSTPSPS